MYYTAKNLWEFNQFGQYRVVEPQRIMWETPVSAPMSVTDSDRGPWEDQPRTLDGFGEVGTSVGSFALSVLGLVVLGGVVIWVVRSIRK
jgi:hypothetical protein